MKKDIQMIIVLIGAMFFFWFGTSSLIIGKQLYGSDAVLLWVSGLLTFMGIQGIANFVNFLRWKQSIIQGGENLK